jgi:TRAP-type C4-dicarboxylate transport system substrate-binding protein
VRPDVPPAGSADDRSMTRAALLAVLLAAGCGGAAGPPPNKSGAAAAVAPTVLQIESPNGTTAFAEEFTRRVQEQSAGALTVSVRQRFPSATPGNEARVGRMVRAGEVDFAILPARIWPEVGAPAFAALQAPFVLTTFEAGRRAIAGPAAVLLERDLERAGVIPLYLAASHPRRFLSRRPLTGLDAFHGLDIRLYDEATTAASVKALGAQPIQGVSTDEVLQRLSDRHLDGLETPAGTVRVYNYWRAARNLTPFAMFSGFETLVASSGAWERLSPSQRTAIRTAAQETARADLHLQAGDTATLEALCGLKVRVTEASPAQLRAFADATEPVRAALRKTPATAEVMRALEATEGAGPSVLPTPAACRTGATPPPARSERGATFPEGVYEVTTDEPDYAGGYIGPKGGVIWTTRFANGKWTRTIDPAPRDKHPELDGAGTYEVHGDEVTFHYTYPEVDAQPPEVLHWSAYGDRLTLKAVRVLDSGALVFYTAHPWRKVR